MASGESASFMVVNRNKRGIGLNLKTDGGRDVLRRLLMDADVVTENYRAGTMEKFGLGYETLKVTQPRADLLRDLRLRAQRTVRREGRLRPDRPRHERHDEHDR